MKPILERYGKHSLWSGRRLCMSIVVCLASYGGAVYGAAADSARTAEAFNEQEKRFRREYRECTGDTAHVTIFELTTWRKTLHDTTETARYRALLEEYMAETGTFRNINPCDVLRWEDARRDSLAAVEDSLEERLIHRANRMVDSLTAARELANTQSSRFDFPGLHFGLSPHAVHQLFAKTFGIELVDKDDYLYAADFAIGGYAFTVFLRFDSSKAFSSYEIRGRSYSADSLDSMVRPQAKRLVAAFEKRFGPAPHLFRIGDFDIKPGRLTPYARWNGERYQAYVGMTMEDYRYRAKALVTPAGGR